MSKKVFFIAGNQLTFRGWSYLKQFCLGVGFHQLRLNKLTTYSFHVDLAWFGFQIIFDKNNKAK